MTSSMLEGDGLASTTPREVQRRRSDGREGWRSPGRDGGLATQIVDAGEGGRPPGRDGGKAARCRRRYGGGWRPSGWVLAAVGGSGWKADQLRRRHRDVGFVAGKYVFCFFSLV